MDFIAFHISSQYKMLNSYNDFIQFSLEQSVTGLVTPLCPKGMLNMVNVELLSFLFVYDAHM